MLDISTSWHAGNPYPLKIQAPDRAFLPTAGALRSLLMAAALGVAALGVAAVGAWGSSALASTASERASVDAERVYRQDALGHAEAIASAYRRLEEYILVGSTGAASWSGSVPPVSMDWLQSWTDRGVRARYCSDVLLVYLGPAEVNGGARRSPERSRRAACLCAEGQRGAVSAPALARRGRGERRCGPSNGDPSCVHDRRRATKVVS